MLQCPQCGAQLAADRLQCPQCAADTALWVGRAGEVFGPYAPDDLHAAQAAGRLSPTDQVMVGTGGAWRPLAEVLGRELPKPPPPPVPPAPPMPARRPGTPAGLIVAVILAVSIVPILLLAAILFPVFAKAREKAQQSTCLSNAKQLSLGLLMYCQDNDERMPSLVPPGTMPAPAAVPAGADSTLAAYPPGDWRSRLYPYVRNSQVFICPDSKAPDSYLFNDELYGVKLGAIARPSETLGLYEKGFLDGATPSPHADMYSVGYVDGHCRSQHRGSPPRTAP